MIEETQDFMIVKLRVKNILAIRTSSNDDKSVITPKAEWDSDFQFMGYWNFLLSYKTI